jgi:transposase
MPKTQRSYTAEYRHNALKLAEEIGTSAAARQLRMPADTLYVWKARAKSGDLPCSDIPIDPKRSLNLAERNKELEQELKCLKAENAQLLRERQILEDATTFFVARRKKSGSV